jgi:hypothetical protein
VQLSVCCLCNRCSVYDDLYADRLQSSSNAVNCLTTSQYEKVVDYLISKYCAQSKV